MYNDTVGFLDQNGEYTLYFLTGHLPGIVMEFSVLLQKISNKKQERWRKI